MKIKVNETLKNSYAQTLFVAGKAYEVVEEDEKRYWVVNDCGWETPVRKSEMGKHFEIVKDC